MPDTEALRTLPPEATAADASADAADAAVTADAETDTATEDTATEDTAETPKEKKWYGNTEAVGYLLYSKYLVPFEVVSVVLLVAMIAAIIYGRKDAALEEGSGRSEQ